MVKIQRCMFNNFGMCFPGNASYAHAMVSVISRYARFYPMREGQRKKGRMSEKNSKRNLGKQEVSGHLSPVFVPGPHRRNEKTRVDESEGRTGQSNHPRFISVSDTIGGFNEYSHSVQNEELVLLLHQRAAPTAGHLRNTISISQQRTPCFNRKGQPTDRYTGSRL